MRSFLLRVLPVGVEVIESQGNRVAPPAVLDYVIITVLDLPRMSTNRDTYVDCRFVGSIVDYSMIVTSMSLGALKVGSSIFGPGVTEGTTVQQILSGSGAAGVYKVSPAAQSVPAGTVMAAGVVSAMQETECSVQLDVHGPGGADNAGLIATMFRDIYAADRFKALNPLISPLYANDPTQMPFVNDQQQIERRWIVTPVLQVNLTVQDIPQEFAEHVVITGIIPADIEYGPEA